MDDAEYTRLAEIYAIKRDRLHLLEKQAALHGADTSPEVAIERAKLRGEVRSLESVIGAPLSAGFVEELGQSGRYLSYQAEQRHISERIALIGRRLDDFIAESQEWRRMHRQWLILIGIVVVVILVAVAVISTALLLHTGS